MTGGLTWQEAVAQIGCDKRTLQRLVRSRKIDCEARPGFPTRYDPVGVAIEAEARRQTVRTGVLAAGQTSNGNGSHAIAHQRHEPTPGGVLLREVLHELRAMLRHGATGATDGVTGAPDPAYVDKAEALAIAGVSYGQLRQAVKAGEVKQRGRRYRRKDLEQL